MSNHVHIKSMAKEERQEYIKRLIEDNYKANKKLSDYDKGKYTPPNFEDLYIDTK